LAVILVVPMCLLCSLFGVAMRQLALDVFVQIGFVVLVGLACKNAILIVEFAKAQHEAGTPRFQATTEACRLRLRPILMTSFAFILGVLPMVIAHGAGAEMRWSLGTAVFSGMLGVTLFGVFLTPVFFYVIEGLGSWSLLGTTQLRWIGSLLLGASAGLTSGWLAWKLNFGPLRLATLGGFAVGVLTALLVQRARRRRAAISQDSNEASP
jgi:multidrug efflux pump